MSDKPELNREYPQPDDDEVAQKIADYLIYQLDRDYLIPPMHRDVHAKTIAAVRAELIVEPDLDPKFRHGIFAHPGRVYSSWVRLSSTNAQPQPDGKKDIRGFALKVMGVEGRKLLPGHEHEQTQDFVFLSTDLFLTKNAADFLEFTVELDKGRLSAIWYFLRNPKILLGLVKSQRVFGDLLELQWFSATPFRLGPNAVKHSLRPQEQPSSQVPEDPTSNYLRERIHGRLASEEVRFDFLVQFQEDPVRDPIENGLVAWHTPWHRVATLRIPPQEVNTGEKLTFGENLSMNAWHTLEAHRPLGSANRARKIVYLAISKHRHERNQVVMVEPTPETLLPSESDGA